MGIQVKGKREKHNACRSFVRLYHRQLHTRQSPALLSGVERENVIKRQRHTHEQEDAPSIHDLFGMPIARMKLVSASITGTTISLVPPFLPNTRNCEVGPQLPPGVVSQCPACTRRHSPWRPVLCSLAPQSWLEVARTPVCAYACVCVCVCARVCACL